MKARILQPGDSVSHYNVGVLFHRQKRYGVALESYLNTSELDPNDPEMRSASAILRAEVETLR